MEGGKLTDVRTVRDRKPVEEYLEKQGRFSHLFEKEDGDEVIEEIQEHIDERAEELGLDG